MLYVSRKIVNVCGKPDDPKDCNGNGICENDDSEAGYSCYCEPGYYGDDCELSKLPIENQFEIQI